MPSAVICWFTVTSTTWNIHVFTKTLRKKKFNKPLSKVCLSRYWWKFIKHNCEGTNVNYLPLPKKQKRKRKKKKKGKKVDLVLAKMPNWQAITLLTARAQTGGCSWKTLAQWQLGVNLAPHQLQGLANHRSENHQLKSLDSDRIIQWNKKG